MPVAVAAVTTEFPGSLLLDVQLKKKSHCLAWLLSVTGEGGKKFSRNRTFCIVFTEDRNNMVFLSSVCAVIETYRY